MIFGPAMLDHLLLVVLQLHISISIGYSLSAPTLNVEYRSIAGQIGYPENRRTLTHVRCFPATSKPIKSDTAGIIYYCLVCEWLQRNNI